MTTITFVGREVGAIGIPYDITLELKLTAAERRALIRRGPAGIPLSVFEKARAAGFEIFHTVRIKA